MSEETTTTPDAGAARPAPAAPRRERGERDRERPSRPKFRRGGGRGRRRVCKFCADKDVKLDYKWSYVLDGFVSERGRIVPSRTTGTCAKHQRALTLAVKRARNVALLPFKAS
ncbi:MAG: small subunit ribosomal protein S18 [Hyphomicrobiaceae bacterium]|jgi:small subunit ribosomal protein S18